MRRAAWPQAVLRLLGAAVAALAAAPTAPEPLVRGRSWDEFPVFVWRRDHRGAPLPSALVLPFGGTNVEQDDEAGWAREQDLAFYVGHAPGRDDLHLDADAPLWRERLERWYATRDDTLLVREPCLSEPATRERLHARLARSLAARGGDHGLGVSLGDEISLAPWGTPFELCRSAACEAAWRAWCAQRGLPHASATTDVVRTALAAGELGPLGGWLARRRFHQDAVQGLLAELAQEARRLAPGVPVGVLGVGGEAAFGDLDVERLVRGLDFLEVYPRGAGRELLATLRGADATPRAVATVYADGTTPEEAALHVHEHWLRGGDGLVIWSDGALERSPAHLARLARAVALVRELRALLPGFPPAPAGVALVHDADAVRLSFLRDAVLDGPTWPRRRARYHEHHGTRERLVRAWLLAFEAAGAAPGAVPLARVGAGTAERFPLLVLPRQLAVGTGDLARLGLFLEAGGSLVLDEGFAWVDREGRRWEEGAREAALAELERRGPGRVAGTPPWLAGVLEASPAARAAAGERARELLRAAGAPQPPCTLVGPEGAAWLLVTARAEDAAGAATWTCAALPNPRLGPPGGTPPEVRPAEGARLVWIRGPRERAGPADPLVFRVEQDPEPGR